MRADPRWCSLCGLAIPQEIVSPSHPLFGTIDHTIARSNKGPDSVFNRAPAHRICNKLKGNRMIDPEAFAAERHRDIVPLLESLGRKIRSRDRAAAIRRVVEGWPAWAPSYKKEADRIQLQRWIDDGGRVSSHD
jgi:HNH endonuclease